MNKARARIVFLNRSYWPDIEATGQLLTDLCEGLADRFDVHVICGQPNSPEKGATYLAEGAEMRNGVTVHRLHHRQHKKGNSLGRILNLVSFYRAAKAHLKTTSLRADVVVSETDPFLLPIAAAKYAERVGAAHCVYLQDVYPDVAEAIGKVRVPGVARELRRRLAKVYRRADRIVVLGRCMRRRLTASPWRIARERIEIVPNWSDCQAIQPVERENNSFREKYKLQDRFVVMHSGNMGLTQRLEILLDATKRPEWPDRAKLVIVGNGAARDRLLEHAKSRQVSEDRVEFIPYQPRKMLSESLSAADLHVVSMHENITGCLCPSKLYGIMAAARPLLAIADPGTDLCQTVRERGLGWCVPPGCPMLTARAVAMAELEARENPSELVRRQRLAREVALERYDRPVILARFARLLADLAPCDERRATASHSLENLDVLQTGVASPGSSDSGIALLP